MRGRRAQFFIIASVIIILNLLAIGAIVRKSYSGNSERPSQEIAIASDFNRTVFEIYKSPQAFRRNIQALQLGIQKGASFSSQIFIECMGETDCSRARIGECISSDCNTTILVKGTSMEIGTDFSGRMGR